MVSPSWSFKEIVNSSSCLFSIESRLLKGSSISNNFGSKTKLRAKEEGVGGNAIIQKALNLYFESQLPNEVWEKSLNSGWIKKISIFDDYILFENIKCRKSISNYSKDDYTSEALTSRGWKKVK